MEFFGNKKSKEERAKEKQEKIKQKEEKELQEFMERFALTGIDERDLKNLRSIKTGLSGTGLMAFGNLLQGSKHTVTESYLSVIIEQNWMLLKELQRIRETLEKED